MLKISYSSRIFEQREMTDNYLQDGEVAHVHRQAFDPCIYQELEKALPKDKNSKDLLPNCPKQREAYSTSLCSLCCIKCASSDNDLFSPPVDQPYTCWQYNQ